MGRILRHHFPQLVLRVTKIPLPRFLGHKKKLIIKELRVIDTLKGVKGTALTPSQPAEEQPELELVVVYQTITKPHSSMSPVPGEVSFHLSHPLARSCDFTTTHNSTSNLKSHSRNCIVCTHHISKHCINIQA